MIVSSASSASPADAFIAAHPEYALTRRLDELRASDYDYLDEEDHVYLDYTGAGLPAKTQLRAHLDRLTNRCFGNPHSENPTSKASTELIEETRTAILSFFNAPADEYSVIFTPNATGACRLVGEAYPFTSESQLVLTTDNHNSIHGIREFARSRDARIRYVPVHAPNLRADDTDVYAALAEYRQRDTRRGLFAFPAQSNFTGVQHPLDWVELAHACDYDVLLDAAAFVPTNRLDLRAVHPDFVAVSWYKMFGYPTGVGCLIARREALARLRRPWFSGGTIRAASALGDWHVMTGDESGFEDGTLNFLAIPDIYTGLSWIQDIGIDVIHQRVKCLTEWLLYRLTGMRHSNGQPMVLIYGPEDVKGRGGAVSFNVLDAQGEIVDDRIVSRDSALQNISLRTGCFCNPGAGEAAFAISPSTLRRATTGATADFDDFLHLLDLPTSGAVRTSVGLASTIDDVERFIAFLGHTYYDRVPVSDGLLPRDRC
jgi:selenocysteine lyase/cysteine desulfurase